MEGKEYREETIALTGGKRLVITKEYTTTKVVTKTGYASYYMELTGGTIKILNGAGRTWIEHEIEPQSPDLLTDFTAEMETATASTASK